MKRGWWEHSEEKVVRRGGSRSHGWGGVEQRVACKVITHVTYTINMPSMHPRVEKSRKTFTVWKDLMEKLQTWWPLQQMCIWIKPFSKNTSEYLDKTIFQKGFSICFNLMHQIFKEISPSKNLIEFSDTFHNEIIKL